MYPFLRLFKEMTLARKQPPLELTAVHSTHHICWPWDIDGFLELNNGRTLTLYDLGRLPLAQRVGLVRVLRDNRWGLTMAGASVRYRRRIRTFERFTMQSRAICWDARFVYLEQSMWKRNGDCASHVLYRSAVTDASGIVPPERVLSALGHDGPSPAMPDWVAAWVAAENTRTWPPMQDGFA